MCHKNCLRFAQTIYCPQNWRPAAACGSLQLERNTMGHPRYVEVEGDWPHQAEAGPPPLAFSSLRPRLSPLPHRHLLLCTRRAEVRTTPQLAGCKKICPKKIVCASRRRYPLPPQKKKHPSALRADDTPKLVACGGVQRPAQAKGLLWTSAATKMQHAMLPDVLCSS